ncbi:MAG: protein-disulfide reductase DsbD N-terminal domain-containing protein, partial [Burkholderiales bacterium]
MTTTLQPTPIQQRWFAALALALMALLSLASPQARGGEAFLDPEQAFPLSVRAPDAQRVEVRLDVAPGYHLYREKINAIVAPSGLAAAPVLLPRGKVEYDATFQKDVEVFRQPVV